MDNLATRVCETCWEYKAVELFQGKIYSKICTICYQIKKRMEAKEYREQNREKCRVQSQEYRAANREKCNSASREYYYKNKEKRNKYTRNYSIKTRYGISIEEKLALLAKQNMVCAICCTENLNWHIDHDHKTGKIRGILCASCNLMLGRAKDSVEILKRAAHYLEIN